MQLNSKTMKNFRDTLALWHIADFVIADEIMQKNARVKSLRTLIDSNNAMIEKITANTNTVTKSLSELQSEIAEWSAKIDSENATMAEFRKEQEKSIKKGYELITAELLTAIKNYLSDIYNNVYETELLNALVTWFSDNGAKDADAESVRVYIRALGLKKGSARSKCKDGKHNSMQSDNAIRDIFLGAICDEPTMQKVLPIHKFTTVIKEKAEKSAK